MALCGLCMKKGEGTVCGFEQWWKICVMYQSCGYFCAVEDLPTYERAVQLEVSPTFFRERFSALATQETLRLDGVTVREESLEALFWLCS